MRLEIQMCNLESSEVEPQIINDCQSAQQVWTSTVSQVWTSTVSQVHSLLVSHWTGLCRYD